MNAALAFALFFGGASLISFAAGAVLAHRRARFRLEAARQHVAEADAARDAAEEQVETLMEERAELFRENGRLRVERQRLNVH